MAEFLKDILDEIRRARNTASDATLIPTDWLTKWADRIEAAALRTECEQGRERRQYEKLHECFWAKKSVQNVIRQMLDARDDLRQTYPKEADDLEYYAHELMKTAKTLAEPVKNVNRAGGGVGACVNNATDHVTKGENVSTSQEPSDGVTKSPTNILREMREYADQLDNDGDITGADFRDFANQLEEAMKREKAITDALLACKDKMIPHPDPDNAPPPYFDNAAPRDTHGTIGEGWYGFDLDGTLARYDGWKGVDHIGEPIPAMVSLIKRLYAEGKVVKIMTARVAPRNDTIDGHDARYYVSNWCAKHLGFIPDIVFQKDARMLELYDDRVKQVVPNTGILVENLAGCGNASALRKALEDTEELLEHFAKPGTMLRSAFYLHMRDNRAALAGPARNCDIYDAENGAAECMQAIDAAWYEIDTIRATIGWMLASVEDSLKKEEGAE